MASNKRKLLNKLKNRYRLVLINDSNFADVFSIKLTPLNVLMLVSSLLVVFSLFIFFVIARTPLREFIPGYGKGTDNSSLIELKEQLQDLEDQRQGNLKKAETLRKILNGESAGLDSGKTQPAAAQPPK